MQQFQFHCNTFSCQHGTCTENLNGTFGHLQDCQAHCDAVTPPPLSNRPRAPNPTAGVSTGSTILIVAVGLLVPYMAIGVAYKRLIVGAVGHEVLPNYEFWSALSGYVHAGYALTAQNLIGQQREEYTPLQ
jgi:hypothetical protein